jgi:hypothetical protein
VAQGAAAGPLAEGDFSNQFRADPVGGATDHLGRRRVEWRLVGGRLGEQGANTIALAVGEPGADLAGEAELVAFVDADEEASDLAGLARACPGASRR